jgi:predicted RecB family nuclease
VKLRNKALRSLIGQEPPAQIKTLLDINVRTVEELAAANEETLNRVGMGGRALKQKAIIWLESSKRSAESLTEEVNAATHRK